MLSQILIHFCFSDLELRTDIECANPLAFMAEQRGVTLEFSGAAVGQTQDPAALRSHR